MNQIIKEMCYNKRDNNLFAKNIKEISGKSSCNTITEQAKAKDVSLMTVIKKPKGFY
jgi:hypothetical protein